MFKNTAMVPLVAPGTHVLPRQLLGSGSYQRFPTSDSSTSTQRRQFIATAFAASFSGAISFKSTILRKRRRELRSFGSQLSKLSHIIRAATGEGAAREEPSFFSGFLKVAQPYFLPLEADEGGGKWLGLLIALLIGVVSGTFWILLGAGTAAKMFAPVLLFPEASKFLDLLNSSPAFPALAGIGVVGSTSAFWLNRRELEGKERQWLLLGLLLFLLFLVTGLNVLLSYVFRTIDNVLVAKNASGFYTQLWIFGGVLVLAVPIIAGYRLNRLVLARDWRSFLTCFFLERYMAHRSYYELDSNSVAVAATGQAPAGSAGQSLGIDNPDQRMTQDVDSFTKETLDLLLDVLDSVLNLFSFASILWVTSRDLTISLVGYALVGTAITLVVGGKLIELNATQLKKEADLRYSLVHIRDNAEAIAFYGGERRELGVSGQRLGDLLSTISELINWTTGLGIFQKAFFYLARLVPYLVIGGLYLSGQVDFGTLGQGTFAFSMVLSSVTLIVSRIQDISRFSAGVQRLSSFLEALSIPADGQDIKDLPRISTHLTSDAVVKLQNVRLETPDGRRLLVENLTFSLGDENGPKRLLVVGPSGVGKSSVLRAIAGLWTRGSGEVSRPAAGQAMFLPQRPYMPLGDLRTQLLYPSDPGSQEVLASGGNHMDVPEWQSLSSRFRGEESVQSGTWKDKVPSDEDICEALRSLGLASLPERFQGGFDAVGDWARTLSLGEQQRIAAARCLLRRPQLAVLDEATSALPVADEKRLYEKLQELDVRCLSVGHRASLLQYHDAVLELKGNGDWKLLSPDEYAASIQ